MKTENEIKRDRFWQALCGSELICRREIASKSGLNMRTVVSYAEQYREKGILSEKTVTDGKGRPEIYYQCHLNNVAFLGVTMFHDNMVFILMDINRLITGSRSMKVSGTDKTDTEFTAHAMKCIEELFVMCPGKILMNAGFCLDEYMTEQKYVKLFRKLLSEFRKKYDVPVISITPSAAVLGRMRHIFRLQGNLALLKIPDEIRLGLILDGQIVSDTKAWAKKIAHFPVSPGGVKCSCGHKGCANCYITHPATMNRYRELSGKDCGGIHKFRLLLDEKDPVCMKIACENGEILGKALVPLASELSLSLIYLYNVDPVTFEAAVESFKKHSKKRKTVIEQCWYLRTDVCAGVIEMCIANIKDLKHAC